MTYLETRSARSLRNADAGAGDPCRSPTRQPVQPEAMTARRSAKVIRVAIVEDDRAILEHLSALLQQQPDMQLVGAASTLAQGRILLDAEPHVMLLDLGLPDGSGLDLIREAVGRATPIEVAAMTVFGDEAHVMGALEAGATGYLLKDGDPEAMLQAVRELHAGGSPISPSIARHVLRRLREPAARAAAEAVETGDTPALLTPRETMVLQQIAKGYSYDEISTTLGISVHTVTTHIKHIYRKLAVRSRGEAVFEAMQLGLIRLEAHAG